MGLKINQNIGKVPTEKKVESGTNFWNRDLSFSSGFGDKKKERFYSDLQVLLNSGIDLKSAFEIIIEEQEKPKEIAFFTNIYNDIILGNSLADSLKKTEKFSDYEYYSVFIGEDSNRLTTVLGELAKYFKDRIELKKQIISVLSYPGFVFLITIGIVYFMLTSVVPMFSDVFKQFGSELPSLTKKIIYISENFSFYALIFGLVLGAILWFIYSQKKHVWFRRSVSGIALKIPVVKSLVAKIYLTRFVQSMHLLLSSKTPLVKSLDLTQKMIRFYPLEIALEEIKEKVTKGESLNSGMKQFAIFPKRLISLVKVGEEVNKLEEMLSKISIQYNEELKYETNIIGKIMEPLILLIIGTVVGVILVAMYLPMFNLGNLMAQ